MTNTPMPKAENATVGPDGRVFNTRLDACAAWLRVIVGDNLQHGEAKKIVYKRQEVIRLLKQMDELE